MKREPPRRIRKTKIRLPKAVTRILDERHQEDAQNPNDGCSWAELKARLHARVRK